MKSSKKKKNLLKMVANGLFLSLKLKSYDLFFKSFEINFKKKIFLKKINKILTSNSYIKGSELDFLKKIC